MKIVLSLLLIMITWLSAMAQKPSINAYLDAVTIKDVQHHVMVLADDSLQGRKTGEAGQYAAARYIAAHYAGAGLQGKGAADNPYYQEFSLTGRPGNRVTLITDDFEYNDDYAFVYAGDALLGERREAVSCYVVGNRPAKELLPSVMGLREAVWMQRNSLNEALTEVEEVMAVHGVTRYFITLPDEEYQRLTNSHAAMHDLSLDLEEGYYRMMRGVVTDDTLYHKTLMGFVDSHTGVELFVVPPRLVTACCGVTSKSMRGDDLHAGYWPDTLRQSAFKVNYNIHNKTSRIHSENVLGFIPGSRYPDEVVIVGGHYDHLGQDDTGIFNGADDNASGTAVVMELARAMGDAARHGVVPECSVLFVAFTAEEVGLYGSEYYVRYPWFQLDSVRLMVNMDMVGRSDKFHDKGENYLYAMTMGPKHNRNARVLRRLDKRFDDLYLADGPGFFQKILWRIGSDHYPFVKRDIPAVVLMSGMHPDYHRVTDTSDKIDYDRLREVVRFVGRMVWQAANGQR